MFRKWGQVLKNDVEMADKFRVLGPDIATRSCGFARPDPRLMGAYLLLQRSLVCRAAAPSKTGDSGSKPTALRRVVPKPPQELVRISFCVL